MECQVMHTRVDVLFKILFEESQNARPMTIVLQIFTVETAPVLAHAQTCYADQMLSVSLKIMPVGVDAELDTLKDRTVTVYQVKFLKFLFNRFFL